MLEPIFDYLERRWVYRQYKQAEWRANETLYLQRLSFQGFGRGTWSHCRDIIPVTKPGEIFEPLTLLERSPLDPEHRGEILANQRGQLDDKKEPVTVRM